MGTREGTSPENDPLMRSMTRTAREKSLARGHLEAVAGLLRARGIEVSPAFTADFDLLAGRPVDALMAVALACTDEADFRRRLREAAE